MVPLEIRMTGRDFEAICAHLGACHEERIALCTAGMSVTAERTALLVRRVLPVPAGAVALTAGGYTITDGSYLEDVVLDALRHGLSVIDFHSHPGSPHPTFSGQDTATHRAFARFFHHKMGLGMQRLCANVVVGANGLDARAWVPHGVHVQPVAVSALKVMGPGYAVITPTSAVPTAAAVDRRFDRQTMVFGPELQQRIARLTVGIVGLSGTGSPLVEQLCRFGVRDFVFVDPDRADVTNFNRLIGAALADITTGAPKVDIARRRVAQVDPAIRVRTVRDVAQAGDAVALLKDCDAIFSCVDSHAARAFLAQLGAKYLIPVFDTGVGISQADGIVTDAGGRVLACVPGEVCLECIPGAYNRQKARYEQLPDEVRGFWHKQGYVRGDEVAAPQVVHFDGVVASYAVAQLHNWLAPFAEPSNTFIFDFRGHAVKHMRLARKEGVSCMVCSPTGLLGLGDLEPFVARRSDDARRPCGTKGDVQRAAAPAHASSSALPIGMKEPR